MAMLVELHLQGQDKFVYTCNNCKNSVETRYHCSTCEVSTNCSFKTSYLYPTLTYNRLIVLPRFLLNFVVILSS